MHFFKLNEIYNCLHLSSINLSTYMFSFNRSNIVQLSKYTSRNLCIKYLNVLTTILDKIVGAFFNPKGIVVK